MSDAASRDLRTLARIAATLDLSVEELLLPRGEPGSGPSSAEIESLFRVFALVRDPQARARIIAAAETELREAGHA